jgi:hypothetical protein
MKKIIIVCSLIGLFSIPTFAEDTSTSTSSTKISVMIPIIGQTDVSEFVKKCRLGYNTDFSGSEGNYLQASLPRIHLVSAPGTNGLELANLSYGVIWRASDGKSGVTAGPMLRIDNLIKLASNSTEWTKNHISLETLQHVEIGWNPRLECVTESSCKMNWKSVALTWGF